MFHTFRAYNLCFRSFFEPPSALCAVTTDFSPDVIILTGSVPEYLENPTIENAVFQVSSTQFILTIRDVARYLITNGQQIIVELFPAADLDRVRLFLFGSAMGALLYQRGLFPLHGSAIATERGVLIFVGSQGIGKSTLAAHFQRRGYTLLSDDVCAVTTDANGLLHVLPAFPHMRLCSDAFGRLENTISMSSCARFDVDKYVIPLLPVQDGERYPLAAVYQLSGQNSPEMVLKKVGGFDAVSLLIANLYRPSYLPGCDTKGLIMQLAALIAQQARISEIFRPHDASRIDELIDMLEEKWNIPLTTLRKETPVSTVPNAVEIR